MKAADFVSFTFATLGAYRSRSLLTATGIAVGIAAVILLTSIGEGVHRFVLAEFTQFGTNIISVTPGRVQTHGGSVGAFGNTRPLTIDDAVALRHAPYVLMTDPVVQGNAEIKAGNRSRRVTVYAVGSEFDDAFSMRVATGTFLPADDPNAARAFVVLGAKARTELFGDANPLGERIQIGGGRYRVIGVMAPRGSVLGFDLDDTVYIPAAKGLELFNREGLFEIHVVHAPTADVQDVVAGLKSRLTARHGREDYTVTPQAQMLETLGEVLSVLTFAVGALGGISLLVGGVGIVTIMHIAVTERTAEIGLDRALGARRRQILFLFLGEAVLLAAAGGAAGLALGAGLAWLLNVAFPALPVHTPWTFAVAAEAMAAFIGLVAGVYPAMRAAQLDPVEALRAE